MPNAETIAVRRTVWRPRRLAALSLAMLSIAAVAPASASASKQVVDFFGGTGTAGGQFDSPTGVAVNQSGAGGVPAGTVYAVDGGPFQPANGSGDNRIERFDPSGSFVSAWGAGVDVAFGGSDYQICTVALECQAGLRSGGNGTLAGDGSLKNPKAIAIDQDTGDVYVSDDSGRGDVGGYDGAGNFRVNVYSATGAFLRSFGWGVAESGPDDNGSGYEVCKAGLDVCKSGIPGSGVGQIGEGPAPNHITAEGIAVSPPDGNAATGTVFLADTANRRVNTYSLDGTPTGSFGSSAVFGADAPSTLAVDSRGIVYVANSANGYEIERYDSENADGGGVGFLAPIAAPVDEVQEVKISATAGQFRLTFGADTTSDLPFNATAEQVESALEALPSIGLANVQVPGGTSTSPYKIEFRNSLGGQNVEQLTASNGTVPLSGGSGASVTTVAPGQAGPLLRGSTIALAVDPDSDGAGPDTDVLYVLRNDNGASVQQFGPSNAPGLTAPPSAVDDIHATNPKVSSGFSQGLGLNEATGRIYASGDGLSSGFSGAGVYVLGAANASPPTASLDSLSEPTSHSVTAHFTVDPNGPPETSYHLEYSTDGTTWKAAPTAVVGSQESPQALATVLDPGGGLEPDTFYHVRLVIQRRFAAPIVATPAELTFTTLPSPPQVETTGSPLRTSTTAQLSGRVDPRNAATTYSFEYIDEASYQANLAAPQPPFTGALATAAKPAGSDDLIHLVSEAVEGLQPATAYRYRVLADNGNPGSPALGEAMSLTTPASDAPLSHGRFPGPPGSDRAWEQVSVPDSGGNPIGIAPAFSADGGRAVYQIFGGTPITNTGSLLSLLFAERTPAGWQSEEIGPPRAELSGRLWEVPTATRDLSAIFNTNWSTDVTAPGGTSEASVWRMQPGGTSTRLLGVSPPGIYLNEGLGATGFSADGSRALALLQGDFDPAYPAASSAPNLYEIGSGTPRLISLLPGGAPAACGVAAGLNLFTLPAGSTHWVSPDGSLAFFPSSGSACGQHPELYMREIEAGATKLISGPPISGPSCGAAFLRYAPGAAFFWTESRLTGDDVGQGCNGKDGDVYRYDVAEETLDCVTCIVAGTEANVYVGAGVGDAPRDVAVSEDGSRVYFQTDTRLLAGAPEDGRFAAYRVAVASGNLAYVAPGHESVGTFVGQGNAINPDGSVLIFRSKDPDLNPLGGTDNGGTYQYYRYDDRDRSLTCVSCPPDGTPPSGGVTDVISGADAPELGTMPLSADGETFAFATPTPLLGADQNTPTTGGEPSEGTDVYEWRDGRLLLITDGLTNWDREAVPKVSGVSSPPGGPEGRDVFFSAAAQLTPDALDAYRRLYDARIGGGIAFPAPPKPCPLEVCQGTPKGAPEEEEPASANFSGAGNAAEPGKARCPKGKRRKGSGARSRCVKPRKHRHRANRNRRAQR